MPSLADRLKELRKNKSVSQKDLSILLGVSERNYRRYELGEIDPPTAVATNLADYFDVSVDYLIGRSDNPTRH